jgi:hypothetical protein
MKRIIMVLTVGLVWAGTVGTAQAGETSLAGYLTYWDADTEGYGAGIKLRKNFLAFFSADIRGGYVDFTDADTSIIPVEATAIVQIPFILEPYVGVGAGYYFVDTEVAALDDDVAGYYGLVGIQFSLFKLGVLGELRYNDAEEAYFEGMSANLGVLLKW